LGIVPGEGLNDLHRRQAGLDQKLHLAMLEEALDEVTLGGAAGIGAEAEANAGVPQPLDVDLVLLERAHRGRAFRILGERLELPVEAGALLLRESSGEERVFGFAAAGAKHAFLARERRGDGYVAGLQRGQEIRRD